MKTFDYVIVGSGCSGAMAAQTLVEAGVDVTMLDVGLQDSGYAKLLPDKDFLTIRRSESEQYRYFIGDRAQSVQWTDIGKAAQIMPPRLHMLEQVDRYLGVQSDTFSPVESLGYGGLGISWGLQCWENPEADLRKAGLEPERIFPAYETVAQRIGVSGTRDDAADYTLGKLKHFQPSPALDRNHRRIYQKYNAKQRRLNRRGIYMSRTPLALLTQDQADRKAYAYRDLDYYSDNDLSAWRPWITVNHLRKQSNFTYLGGYLALSFQEKPNYTEIHCLKIPTNELVSFRCKKLLLATNPLSSARIALRSLGEPRTRLPLLCNPYTYIPCIQPSMIGQGPEPKKLGLAQLSLFLDESGNNKGVSVASLYAYQSLMMFRTIRQVPLNFVDSRELLRLLMPAIVIMGVHHPDKQSPQKYIQLMQEKTSPTGDILRATYELSDQERREFHHRENKLVAAMRSLGVYALKKINPGYGASIHYAGTMPFSQTEAPLTLSPSGLLHGTKRVYVADSAGFTYLPARGLTFTLMANAHVTAQEALKHG